MATDITNPSSFSFNNMKPANDEETTSLFAQNLADNTGLLYFQNYLACSFSNDFFMEALTSIGTFRQGTLLYKKQPNTNRLDGRLSGEVYSEGFYGGTAIVYVNGVEGIRGKFGESAGADPGPDSFATSFTIDVSGLTDYQDYEIGYSLGQTQQDVGTKWSRHFNISCSMWGTKV